MRITRITLHVVNVPERHWWWSDDEYGQPYHQRAEHGIAEVETDDGLTGLTQVERFSPMDTVEAALRSWIGLDVLAADLAHPRGSLPAAFEQVILDLRGQALGVPLWQLLGGRLRDRVPITQCTGYKTVPHTAEDAAWGQARGFKWYKMKCCTHRETTPAARVDYIADRVQAIHEAAPGMQVRPDIRWRLEEVWVAQQLARRLDGLPVECLESPIAKGAAGGSHCEWRRLRYAIPYPIADHVGGADDLLARHRAEALDYAIVGAASHLETLRLSHLAHQLGMGGWSQCVAYGPGAAMGLHVAACMANLTQPYDMVGPMAWEHDLTQEPFEFQDGCLLVPDRPGLGFTLDREAVAKYLVNRYVYAAE